MNSLLKFFYFISSFIWNPRVGGENVWKKYLIIKYVYDKEIVESNLNIKLKEYDFINLKQFLSANCSRFAGL